MEDKWAVLGLISSPHKVKSPPFCREQGRAEQSSRLEEGKEREATDNLKGLVFTSGLITFEMALLHAVAPAFQPFTRWTEGGES